MSVIDALSEGQLRVEEFRDELARCAMCWTTPMPRSEWQTRPFAQPKKLEEADEPPVIIAVAVVTAAAGGHLSGVGGHRIVKN